MEFAQMLMHFPNWVISFWGHSVYIPTCRSRNWKSKRVSAGKPDTLGFPGDHPGLWGASQVALVVKNPPANAGDARDAGLIPGLGRSPGAGNGNPLQFSCLENPMDRGAWWTTVHKVAKSQTHLKRLSVYSHIFTCLDISQWLEEKSYVFQT